MQIFLFSMWPTVVYILLYLIGLFSALEGKRLNIAGMTYFVYGFALLILAEILSLVTMYFIIVMQAIYGPMIAAGNIVSVISGTLGVIFLIVGVRAIVSAYKMYFGSAQQVS